MTVSRYVSIIVPVYNVEKYISICIDSLINQTLKSIEIILINDGSTDNSGLIADEFSKFDTRIKVIHKINGGLSSARNEGLMIASGRYISFIDSDDWVEPTMMEDMYNAAVEINADILVSGVIVEYPLENRTVINNLQESISTQDMRQLGNVYWKLHNAKLSNYAWNKLFKNSFIRDIGLKFIIDGMPAEDLFFNLSSFSHAKSIGVLNHAYYHYIKRDESSILTKYQENILQVEIQRKAAYESFFEHFNMKGEEHLTFLDRLIVISNSSLVINLYKTNAPFNRKDRRSIISEKIFLNDELKTKIPNYIKTNAYENIFVLLYKYSNPYLMEFTYSVLFLLRRKFLRLYMEFRRLELK